MPKVKEEPKIEPVDDLIDDADPADDIEPTPEPIKPRKETLLRKKSEDFANKLDLSPILNKLDLIDNKIKKDEPAPAPAPKPEPRKYRLFDEFDPTLEG